MTRRSRRVGDDALRAKTGKTSDEGQQERGLREKHERPDGFQVGASRTIAAPVSSLYAAWFVEDARAAWLEDAPLVVRKSAPEKSLRLDWEDGATRVDVNFYGRGEAKSQVAVTHSRLPDPSEAARMKAYWAEALDRLRATFEE